MLGIVPSPVGAQNSVYDIQKTQPVVLTAHEAIYKAADAAPDAIAGTYEITIKAFGEDDGVIYLNSELDYRDQRCLTVALLPSAQTDFKKRFDVDPKASLIGKKIRITAPAKRMKVFFTADGRTTGKYYYQTHVVVTDLDQIITID